jgi:hypothetical protein
LLIQEHRRRADAHLHRLGLETLFEVDEETVLVDNLGKSVDRSLVVIKDQVKPGNIRFALLTFPIDDLFVMGARRLLLVVQILLRDASLQPLINVWLPRVQH